MMRTRTLAAIGMIVALLAACAGGSKKPEPMMFVVTGSVALHAADYGFRNLFDGDSAKAWCTQNLRSAADRELTIEFEEPVMFRALEFQGGYFKSEKVFRANGRLRRVTIAVGDGQWPLTFDDARTATTFAFPDGISGSEMTITIDDVYEPDTVCDFCVSELVIAVDGGDSKTLMNPSRETASDEGIYARWTGYAEDESQRRCDFRIATPAELIGTLGECPWYPDESIVGFGPKGLIYFNWRDRYEAARYSDDCGAPEGEETARCIESPVMEWYLLEE